MLPVLHSEDFYQPEYLGYTAPVKRQSSADKEIRQMGEIPITCFVFTRPEHIEVYSPGSQLHLIIILAILEQSLWHALCWKSDSPH